MDENTRIELQRMNENRFNRKHIEVKLQEFISTDANMLEGVMDGVAKLEAWINKPTYQQKAERIAPLQTMDLKQLVISVFVGVATTKYGELFTSVSARIAGRLGFDDKPAAITTMAEILAVLCQTDVFDIYKLSKYDSLKVKHNMPLPESLKVFIQESEFLPPMVCKPLELTDNYSSGYLTHKDSVILGSGNHHNGDVCLDVLNIMNSTELSLCIPFLDAYEETPSKPLETPEQQDQWKAFKEQSRVFYALMIEQGNRFYLTHNWDKRGRLYARGYHISTQGAPYKKASIELAKKEVVEGTL